MGLAAGVVTSGDFPDETLVFAKEHPLLHGAVAPAGGRPLFTRTGTRCAPAGGQGGLEDGWPWGQGVGSSCKEGVSVQGGEGAASPVGAVGWGGSSCKAPVQGCTRPWCKGRARPSCKYVQSPGQGYMRACKTWVQGPCCEGVQQCARPHCKCVQGSHARVCKTPVQASAKPWCTGVQDHSAKVCEWLQNGMQGPVRGGCEGVLGAG